MDAALGSGYGMPTDYNYAQLEGPTVSLVPTVSGHLV